MAYAPLGAMSISKFTLGLIFSPFGKNAFACRRYNFRKFDADQFIANRPSLIGLTSLLGNGLRAHQPTHAG